MKKFNFSLQKLLDYKEQLFDVERTILGDMHAALNGMLEERDEMRRQHTGRSAELREKMIAGISAIEMETHKNFLTMLDFSIKQKEQQIELQRKAIDKQTDKVKEAKIELSTIEKLKERKLEDYNYEANKAEQAFIEEFVSNKKATSQSERHAG